ncbi:MAG: tRNA1(Val) (adenine(37)-N6)-methyltransferase [Crocinitomicaceae bacterium]
MSTFEFKHFTIKQEASAMKVGTDAMLLGSMAGHPNPSKILDVGAGTGVIALMMAQRFDMAKVDAVEIDPSAFEELKGNVGASIFKDRVNVFFSDFLKFKTTSKFDLIVSNPPYFMNSLKNSDRSKSLARHADGLSAIQFLSKSTELLNNDGRIQIVIPFDLVSSWEAAGLECGLYINQITEIKGKPSTAVNRAILTFEQKSLQRIKDLFTVRNDDNSYSDEYIKLTSEFHDRIPR